VVWILKLAGICVRVYNPLINVKPVFILWTGYPRIEKKALMPMSSLGIGAFFIKKTNMEKEKWTMEQKLTRIKEVHSEATNHLITNLIGKEVDKDFFITAYIAASQLKYSPSKKKRSAGNTYDFLVKEGIFKAK